jgi:heat-inducible transcriptional repressor
VASHDVPIGANQVSLAALNERSREIFRHIVESYLTTGEPLGSRNLARLLPILSNSGSSLHRIPRPEGCRPNLACAFSSMH